MKKIILALTLILVVLAVASCSGGISAGSTNTPNITDTATPAKVVKVYGAPGWSWCAKVKEFLDQNKIAYQYYDVSTDKAAYQEMYSISQRTAVPQILIDGQMIIGFNEPLLRQKLGLSAASPPTLTQPD